MIPAELCHYTKMDIALENIIHEKRIKLGVLGMTNDPKETNWKPFSIIYPMGFDPQSQDRSEQILLADEMQRVAKEEWKVLCMTQHLPKRHYKSFFQNHTYSNFREGYNRPRMWAQYSENHAGVCIVFDGKILLSKITIALKDSKIFHGPVCYKDHEAVAQASLDYEEIQKHGLTEGIRNYYFVNCAKCFLTKYPDWQNESEYRILVHNTRTSAEFVNIAGAIKGILVGWRFPLAYEPSLKELCKKWSIPAGRMQWSNGFPTAVFDNIFKP